MQGHCMYKSGIKVGVNVQWLMLSTGALDHITVSTKDGKFPLNQLGQISMKSPQLIVINMTSYPEVSTPSLCREAKSFLSQTHINIAPLVL